MVSFALLKFEGGSALLQDSARQAAIPSSKFCCFW